MAYCSIDTSGLESEIEQCVDDALSDYEVDTEQFMTDLESLINSPCGTWEETIDAMNIASFKRIIEEGDNYDLFKMMGWAIKQASATEAMAATDQRIRDAVNVALTNERARVAALNAQVFMRELTKWEVSDGQDL